MLDLHIGNLDAPAVGLAVENLLDVLVELVALGQNLVEFVLAEHRAQGGLSQLAGGVHKVLYGDDGLFRIDDPVIDHGIDPHGDVVM